MPIIKATTLAIAGFTAATSITGGFFVKDDVVQTSQIAATYAEQKIDQYFESAAKQELQKIDQHILSGIDVP
ncbi:hypothetical protein L4D76_24150 [Photobacterium sagamiensis]|uniref:hypothetical protein n=1 Tax=Photobacterium sagamiensis TaxID=2910241 RepID=UPI003D0E6B2E